MFYHILYIGEYMKKENRTFYSITIDGKSYCLNSGAYVPRIPFQDFKNNIRRLGRFPLCAGAGVGSLMLGMGITNENGIIMALGAAVVATNFLVMNKNFQYNDPDDYRYKQFAYVNQEYIHDFLNRRFSKLEKIEAKKNKARKLDQKQEYEGEQLFLIEDTIRVVLDHLDESKKAINLAKSERDLYDSMLEKDYEYKENLNEIDWFIADVCKNVDDDRFYILSTLISNGQLLKLCQDETKDRLIEHFKDYVSYKILENSFNCDEDFHKLSRLNMNVDEMFFGNELLDKKKLCRSYMKAEEDRGGFVGEIFPDYAEPRIRILNDKEIKQDDKIDFLRLI